MGAVDSDIEELVEASSNTCLVLLLEGFFWIGEAFLMVDTRGTKVFLAKLVTGRLE